MQYSTIKTSSIKYKQWYREGKSLHFLNQLQTDLKKENISSLPKLS